MLEFETQVSDIDIYGLEGDANTSASGTVKWNVEMEARSWGLKGISVFPTSVKCSLMIEKFNKEKDDYDDEEEMLIDSAEGWKVETEGLEKRDLISDIAPHNIGIDFKDKSITVNF